MIDANLNDFQIAMFGSFYESMGPFTIMQELPSAQHVMVLVLGSRLVMDI
jgi:hypothetical protein